MPEALARTGICEETIRCGLTNEAAASNQTQEVNIVYRKVDTNLNFVDREKEVEKFWKDNKIFEKSMDSRKEGETYTFYDGPPTANGKPHIGHVLTRVIKDMIPRYRTMKGTWFREKQDGILTDFRLSLRLRRSLALTARSRSRSTEWSRSSSSVKRAYGNTRECGRISPLPLVSGLTWSIRM